MDTRRGRPLPGWWEVLHGPPCSQVAQHGASTCMGSVSGAHPLDHPSKVGMSGMSQRAGVAPAYLRERGQHGVPRPMPLCGAGKQENGPLASFYLQFPDEAQNIH